MTLQELSVEFDILFNNISSNQAPGLSEYEKSVFLTQAMEAVILDLYKGTGGDSFESTEELTRYLNTLVKSKTLPVKAEETEPIFTGKTYYANFNDSGEDNIEKDLWFIVYQSAKLGNDNILVVPTTLDKVYKEMQNPFKKPNGDRILVLFQSNKAYLLSDEKVDFYYIKYLSRPYPIILDEDSLEDLTINGYNTSKELSEIVPETLHRTILLRAIQLAQIVWKQS